MKVLILGSGAREYSIALALQKSPQNPALFFYPGNAATPALGENIFFSNSNDELAQLAQLAQDEKIDLTIVGSEDFLARGVVDLFRERGLNIFGPTQAAAQLESSKIFMKELLQKNHIKTARFFATDSLDAALEFIPLTTPPVVIKADGLCAGKGVIIAPSHAEAEAAAAAMLSGESFGEAGRRIIIEEFLEGFELSVFALCDGEDFVLLPPAQDYKKLLDGDLGPNTGGMGALAPSPLATPALMERIKNELIAPTLAAMRAEGRPFAGALFAGIMVVGGEPFVLEFNVRLGDPETEVLMPLITNPLELFAAAARPGGLAGLTPQIRPGAALGVVLASANYPHSPSAPAPICIGQIPANAQLSFAGVGEAKDSQALLATGGRVCVCVGLGPDLAAAREAAYELVGQVSFEGAHFRQDIGLFKNE